MDADQRTGADPVAVRVTSVVSPSLPAETSRCPALFPLAPATLRTSTETSGSLPLAKRPPGVVRALPAFS